MTTYSYKDLITVENYYQKYENYITLEKIDIFKIYNNINFFQNINDLKFNEIGEYFPLFKLLNIKIDNWKNYKYEYSITNLSPKDLDVNMNTIDFIQSQFIKYIIKQWNYIYETNSRILLLLTLIDFLSKTIDINNKKFMNTLISKLEPEKDKILNFGIINENILNDLLNLKT